MNPLISGKKKKVVSENGTSADCSRGHSWLFSEMRKDSCDFHADRDSPASASCRDESGMSKEKRKHIQPKATKLWSLFTFLP